MIKNIIGKLNFLNNWKSLLTISILIFLLSNLLRVFKTTDIEIYFKIFEIKNTIVYFVIAIISILILNKIEKKNYKNLIVLFVLIFIFDFIVVLKSLIQRSLLYIFNSESNTSSSYFLIILILIFCFLLAYRFIDRKLLTSLKVLFIYSLAHLISSFIIFKPALQKFNVNLKKVHNIGKSHYIVISDEYPDIEILKKKFNINSGLDSILKNRNFKKIDNISSDYISTEKVLSSILSGVKDENANIYKLNYLLNNNRYNNDTTYKFYLHSVFQPEYMKGSFLSYQFYYNFNSVITRYILPNVIISNDEAKFKNYNWIHQEFLKKVTHYSKSNGNKIVLVHLLTPHVNPQNINQSLNIRINHTNDYIKSMVDTIQLNDPSCGIIILGDHGLRSVKLSLEEKKKTIFYYYNTNFEIAFDRHFTNIDYINNIIF